MTLITPADVIRKIELYHEGGAVRRPAAWALVPTPPAAARPGLADQSPDQRMKGPGPGVSVDAGGNGRRVRSHAADGAAEPVNAAAERAAEAVEVSACRLVVDGRAEPLSAEYAVRWVEQPQQPAVPVLYRRGKRVTAAGPSTWPRGRRRIGLGPMPTRTESLGNFTGCLP
jgi:hypothetical protein